MTPKLFGTDGVRGLVGRELTAELALALGRAVAMESAAARPQVLIVRDTRESGPMLEAALAAGVAEGGGDAWLAGVLPTPAASILVRRHGLDLAAVVSASHNPWRHNGIKFFGANGRKLEDDAEAGIEERVVQGGSEPGMAIGRVRELDGALDDYRRALLSAFRLNLSGRALGVIVTSAGRNVPTRLPAVESAKIRPATAPAVRTSSTASRIANGVTIPSRITGGAKSTSAPRKEPITAPAESRSSPRTETSRNGWARKGTAAIASAAAVTTAPSTVRLGLRSASRPPSQ